MTEELPNDTIHDDPSDDVSDDSQLLTIEPEEMPTFKILIMIIISVILIYILSRWS